MPENARFGRNRPCADTQKDTKEMIGDLAEPRTDGETHSLKKGVGASGIRRTEAPEAPGQTEVEARPGMGDR